MLLYLLALKSALKNQKKNRMQEKIIFETSYISNENLSCSSVRYI